MSTSSVLLRASLVVNNEQGLDTGEYSESWTTDADMPEGISQPLTIAAGAFAAIPIPALAVVTGKLLLVISPDFKNCTLKGVTGDTGIKLNPNSTLPIIIPISGDTNQIGIKNTTASSITGWYKFI